MQKYSSKLKSSIIHASRFRPFGPFRVLHKLKRRKLATIPFGLMIVLGIGLFVYIRYAYGVTRTWDGGCGVDTSWSCDANWSSDTEPGASDLAQFDTFDGDANIDATYAGSVGGVQITANYDGTITQERSLAVGTQNFSQAGGNWDGNAQTFDLAENFTVSGGTHTATTGTWTVENNFTHSGGTLDMTGATVTFDGSSIGSGANTTFTCSGSVGGTINVAKTGNGGNFTLASGCSITFAEDTSTIGGITINGTVDHTVGTTPTLDLTRVSQDGILTIGSTGTYNFSGSSITIYNDLTVTSGGTFDVSGATITFDGSSSGSGANSVVTCTGTLDGIINVAKSSNGGNFTLAEGCTAYFAEDISSVGAITINGTAVQTTGASPTLVLTGGSQSGSLSLGSSGIYIFSGTAITLLNNLTLSSGAVFDASAVTVTFNGSSIGSSADTTMTCTGTFNGTVNVAKSSNGGNFTLAAGCTVSFQAAISTGGSMTINGTVNHTSGSPTLNLFRTFHNGSLTINSGGTYNYGGTSITLDNSFTLASGGSFDLTGITLTLDGTTSGDDATVTCGETINGNITINKTDAGGDTTFASNCTILGDFTRTNGPVTNPSSARTVIVHGNFSMSTTDTFGGSNLTLEFGGSGNQTITQNAGAVNNNISVNKSAGTASLSTDLRINGAATVSAGILDLNNRTFLSPQGFTIADGGTLELYGSEAYTAPTFNSGSTIKYTGDGDAGADTYGAARAWTTYNTTVAMTDSGDTVTAGNTLATNLEAYWNMDESSWTNDCSTGTILDSTANSNEALSCPASTGPTGGASGNFGNAGFFDGSDDFVSIPTNAIYDNSGTWNIWMKSDGTWGTGASDPTNRAAIMARSDSSSCSGIHILPRPSGIITVAVYRTGCAGATVANFQSNSSVVTDNNWHMVTLVFNQASGGRVALYIDGELDSFSNTSNSWSFNSHNIRLARDFDSFWETYEGYLDDVRIYSRELSAQEVANLYADGVNTSTSTLDVNHSFTQSSGIFTAPTSNMTVGGSFTRSGGTFTHNSGTVVFDDVTKVSAISGTTTFNNLTSITAGKKITVQNGTTQTVNTLTLTGSAGNRIRITGAQGASQWDLIATTDNVSYVEARDSDACGGATIETSNSVNLGNNSCWDFSTHASYGNGSNIQGGVNIFGGTNLQ